MASPVRYSWQVAEPCLAMRAVCDALVSDGASVQARSDASVTLHMGSLLRQTLLGNLLTGDAVTPLDVAVDVVGSDGLSMIVSLRMLPVQASAGLDGRFHRRAEMLFSVASIAIASTRSQT